MFKVEEYVATLKRRTKAEDIPGTVDSYLEDMCPTGCGGQLRKMKACCGSPQGYLECSKCHYRVN